MMVSRTLLNRFFAAFLYVLGFAHPMMAQDAIVKHPPESSAEKLDDLFVQLQRLDLKDWKSIEEQIWQEWSKSGSATIDLLLTRGRAAIEKGDYRIAIEHLSALTDHAPDFAEGWNARATAFYMAENYVLSIADIERALALNPRHFAALQGLGQILEKISDDKNALTAYKAAITLHPQRDGLKEAVERLERKLEGEKL